MQHAVFSWPQIAGTAAVCARVAALVLGWRARRGGMAGTRGRSVALAVGLGVVVLAWRAVSNALLLNDDFLPAVSVADVGSGVVALLGLLALAWLPPGGPARAVGAAVIPPVARATGAFPRDWVLTSVLVALAVFACNVVLI